MEKDEFVKKYLNCKSETDKAALIFEMIESGKPQQVCPSPFSPGAPLPTAPYGDTFSPADRKEVNNFTEALRKSRIYCQSNL